MRHLKRAGAEKGPVREIESWSMGSAILVEYLPYKICFGKREGTAFTSLGEKLSVGALFKKKSQSSQFHSNFQ
jgi:hypothetical protein